MEPGIGVVVSTLMQQSKVREKKMEVLEKKMDVLKDERDRKLKIREERQRLKAKKMDQDFKCQNDATHLQQAIVALMQQQQEILRVQSEKQELLAKAIGDMKSLLEKVVDK